MLSKNILNYFCSNYVESEPVKLWSDADWNAYLASVKCLTYFFKISELKYKTKHLIFRFIYSFIIVVPYNIRLS